MVTVQQAKLLDRIAKASMELVPKYNPQMLKNHCSEMMKDWSLRTR